MTKAQGLSEAELLPCPFCGGPATLRGWEKGVCGLVSCLNDECFGPRASALTEEDAIVQWNTRTVASPTGARRETVEEVVLDSETRNLVVQLSEYGRTKGAPKFISEAAEIIAVLNSGLKNALTEIERLRAQQAPASGSNAP